MMSRLIVLVHLRHTGPGFTSTSPALKRRDLRYRAGCALSAIEKGEVGMEGVCSLRLPQRSLVDGLVGFECRHLAASRWTPREGPNSCSTLLLLYVCMYVAHLKGLMIVLRCAKAGFGRRTSSSSEASRLWQKRALVKVVNLSPRCSADSTSSSQSEHLFKLQSAIPQNLLWPYSNKKSTQGFIFRPCAGLQP